MRARPLVLVFALVVVVAGVAVGATLLGVAPWQPAIAGPIPHFVDDTEASGLDFTYDGPFTYAFGGGVAVLDCNGDGREDLYIAGGAGAAALYRNDSQVGGALRFSRLPDAATDLDAVNGAYPIDIDGDGVIDLIVLRNGENVALRGLGDCRFERSNEAWGLDGGAELTEAFSATWEAGSTRPTLAFGNYAVFDNDPSKLCQPNFLIRPVVSGDGFSPPIRLDPGFCALSMLFSDWDGSGRMDLRVSNDQHYYDPQLGEEQLWRIEPGAAPRLYTAGEGWQRVQIQGMGIASQDLTGDGLPEIYLTSQAANRLQTLAEGPSQPAYRDIGGQYGVNAAQPFAGGEHLPSTAWHPEFEDVNNDGFLDLLVTKGNVTTQPDYAQKDPTNLLLGQPDGTFKEAADLAGILTFDRGRGAALADFNLDGRLDLVEVMYAAPVRLWRNEGPVAGSGANHQDSWLGLRVTQPGPNRDAIGAVVEVRSGPTGPVDRRELTVGGGHAGGQLGWLHFGLGATDSAEIRVMWPGGETSDWQRVAANGFYELDRGGVPVAWTPPGGAE